MNTFAVLKHLHPTLEPLVDYVLETKDGQTSIVRWMSETVPQPTQEELEAAWVTLEAAFAQQAALKSGLLAAWDTTFTAGEKAFLEPLYNATLAALDAGDIAKVKELILTAPSISVELDSKRETLVNILPK